MSTANLSISRGATNAWTLTIASGTGPVLMSAKKGAIEWCAAASLPASSIFGHLLQADEPSILNAPLPETYYFNSTLALNIYTRPVGDSAIVVTTTDSDIYGG